MYCETVARVPGSPPEIAAMMNARRDLVQLLDEQTLRRGRPPWQECGEVGAVVRVQDDDGGNRCTDYHTVPATTARLMGRDQPRW
jgi:hypothetical protein